MYCSDRFIPLLVNSEMARTEGQSLRVILVTSEALSLIISKNLRCDCQNYWFPPCVYKAPCVFSLGLFLPNLSLMWVAAYGEYNDLVRQVAASRDQQLVNWDFEYVVVSFP